LHLNIEPSDQIPWARLGLARFKSIKISNMLLMVGNKKLILELNTLGQEGWETVAVSAKSERAMKEFSSKLGFTTKD
jgi:hypothetical protein